jgi:hypothetical protein
VDDDGGRRREQDELERSPGVPPTEKGADDGPREDVRLRGDPIAHPGDRAFAMSMRWLTVRPSGNEPLIVTIHSPTIVN